jgi:KDO2-lipid IV(A) lauroyltransferase
MIGVTFYKLGAFLSRRLPQTVSESITESLVRSQYLFRLSSRRIVLNNLRIVLGRGPTDAELMTVTRRIFSNFGKSIYYFLRAPSMTGDELLSRVNPNGIEELIPKLNGGFVIVGPHLGPWEIGGAFLTRLGMRLRTVALPHRSHFVTGFFDRHRTRMGVESYPLDSTVESLRGALSEGKGVALLVDRAYGNNRRQYSWFGREVDMPMGHVALAVRARVPLVTCACVFDGDSRFKLVWNGPYHADTRLSHDAAMDSLQTHCLRDMEELIRSYIDQWFLFHPLGIAHHAHTR